MTCAARFGTEYPARRARGRLRPSSAVLDRAGGNDESVQQVPLRRPERDFRVLIEDRLNVISPPMQEEALRRGQFVGASAVLVAGLALPAYHDFPLHRRNRDPS